MPALDTATVDSVVNGLRMYLQQPEQVAKHTSALHIPELENTYTAAAVKGKFWSDKGPVFAFETFLSFLSGDFQHSWLSGMLAIMVASHLV